MMGNKWCVLIIFLFCSHYVVLAENVDDALRRELEEEDIAYEQYSGYVKEIIDIFVKQMHLELRLDCTGEGGRMHKQVEEIRLNFEAHRRATLHEARALELYVISQFLAAINSHPKIQPYLLERPFTYKRVAISISFQGLNGSQADGTIKYVFSVPEEALPQYKNTIEYCIFDPFKDDNIVILEEPYEESVQLAKASDLKFPFTHQTTAQEDAIDHFLATFTNQMQKKRGLKCWSIGGKMTHGIDEIGARFHAFYRVSQQEARELAVFVTEQLLDALNHDEKLKPFLNEHPFPASRVKLRIEFTDRKFVGYSEETMDSVVLEGNELLYYERKQHPQEDVDKEWWSWLTRFKEKESYQEGLTAVKKAPPPSLFKKIRSLPRMLQHWLSG